MLLFNSITFDYGKMNYFDDGHTLRTGYLFSDKLLASGQCHFSIAYEHHYANPSEGLKKSMVLNYCKQVPDPLYYQEVEKMYEILKQGRKEIKHAPTPLIIARKRIEKALDQLFQSSMETNRNAFIKAGYAGLYALAEEEAIDILGTSLDKPETSDRNSIPYSEILSGKWKEEDELYIFSQPFWQYVAENHISLTGCDEAEEDAPVITYRLPQLPPLHHFTTGELKSIKQEVFGEMSELRKAIEQWSLQLKGEDFSSARFNEYNRFFSEKIQPHLALLEEKINNCALLQKSKAMFKQQAGADNFLAVGSAKTVWNFMEWGGLVPKESMHIFEQQMPEGCTGDKAMLLLLCRPFNNLPQEDDGDKKSLQL